MRYFFTLIFSLILVFGCVYSLYADVSFPPADPLPRIDPNESGLIIMDSPPDIPPAFGFDNMGILTSQGIPALDWQEIFSDPLYGIMLQGGQKDIPFYSGTGSAYLHSEIGDEEVTGQTHLNLTLNDDNELSGVVNVNRYYRSVTSESGNDRINILSSYSTVYLSRDEHGFKRDGEEGIQFDNIRFDEAAKVWKGELTRVRIQSIHNRDYPDSNGSGVRIHLKDQYDVSFGIRYGQGYVKSIIPVSSHFEYWFCGHFVGDHPYPSDSIQNKNNYYLNEQREYRKIAGTSGYYLFSISLQKQFTPAEGAILDKEWYRFAQNGSLSNYVQHLKFSSPTIRVCRRWVPNSSGY